MSASIHSVITDLFNAPIQAAVKAEAGYLQAWAQWLEFKKSLMFGANGAPLPGIDIATILATAPVVELNGNIELGITMRIAEVTDSHGGLDAGLKVGPFYASGSYGFNKSATSESVFQASAVFVLSNQKKDLVAFLQNHNLTLAKADDVNNAVKKLKEAAKAIEAPPVAAAGN